MVIHPCENAFLKYQKTGKIPTSLEWKELCNLCSASCGKDHQELEKRFKEANAITIKVLQTRKYGDEPESILSFCKITHPNGQVIEEWLSKVQLDDPLIKPMLHSYYDWNV